MTEARWPRIVVLALVVCFALLWFAYTVNATRGIWGWDAQAYWQAAMRLREGAPLYAASGDPELNAAYRYAPWFAFVWTPLTYASQAIVTSLWSALVFVAWTATLWPMRRHPSALIFLAALTFHAAWVGNVQSLMLLPLVYRLDRTDGPFWIGIAASLKGLPILLVLFYIGRGEWRRAFVSGAVAAVLVAPMLAFDLSHYPFESPAELSLAGISGIVWLSLAMLAVLTALYGARKPWGPLAAGVAVIAGLPRLLLYDASYLLVGSGRGTRAR